MHVGSMSFARAGCQLFSLARCNVTGSVLAQLKHAGLKTDSLSNLSEVSSVYLALTPASSFGARFSFFFFFAVYQIKTHPTDIYLL